MASDAYHQDFESLSSTMLKQFWSDRSVYYDRYVAKSVPAFEPTKPMEMGSILHSILLDGEPLRSVVGVYPDRDERLSDLHKLTGPKRDALSRAEMRDYAKLCGVPIDVFASAKGGKELKAVLANAPKNVITSAGGINSKEAEAYREGKPEYKYWLKRSGGTLKSPCFETVKQAVSAVRDSDYYQILESDRVIKEKPIYWTCRHTGRKMRCCPDFLLIDAERGMAFVWDLKITQLTLKFDKQMHSLGYWIQQQHYSEGVLAEYPEISQLNNVIYTFLAASPVYPYHVLEYQYQTTGGGYAEGHDMDIAYQELLRDLAWCEETDDFTHPKAKETNMVPFKNWSD